MKPLLMWVVLGQSADMTTSLMAFHRGAHELNPLVVSTKPVPFITQGVIWTTAETLLLRKLSKNHPKIAKTLAYISIGGSVAASIQNLRVYHRLKYQQPGNP